MSTNYEELFERAKKSVALTPHEHEAIRALLENYTEDPTEPIETPSTPVTPEPAGTAA